MNHILQPGQQVCTGSNMVCTVQHFIGGGGQGEVYEAAINGRSMALKWYLPDYLAYDPHQKARLEKTIAEGPPTNRFLWPTDLASAQGVEGFGYVMPLRESRFVGIQDLMRKRVEPTFRTLATAGYQLADSFHELHAKGLCYRDISFGNVFFDPDLGDVRICDNDNVDVNNATHGGGIAGTPRFMAPEIVRGEAMPSTGTDLYSLSVLLFHMFMVHHPLDGRKEAEIHCLDLHAMEELYGKKPVFIFDPNDNSNRPLRGYHDNALDFWEIYPQFLRRLFEQAFTLGIRDPTHGRVQENQWRLAMLRLRDAVVYCNHCSQQNFYDAEGRKSASGVGPKCWNCKRSVQIPPRIQIGSDSVHQVIVMLNHDAQLYPHHVDNKRRAHDFSVPVAEVTQHPTDPGVWGIKNLSEETWTATTFEGVIRDVPPGRSVSMAAGTRIRFGRTEGEVCL